MYALMRSQAGDFVTPSKGCKGLDMPSPKLHLGPLEHCWNVPAGSNALQYPVGKVLLEIAVVVLHARAN